MFLVALLLTSGLLSTTYASASTVTHSFNISSSETSKKYFAGYDDKTVTAKLKVVPDSASYVVRVKIYKGSNNALVYSGTFNSAQKTTDTFKLVKDTAHRMDITSASGGRVSGIATIKFSK